MEPTGIAIIGLACRFPAAASPREFWRLVRDGHEIGEHEIEGVADFDADFFGVAPREASAMDPRQRLALELVWELFEDARILPETVRGQRVSVHVGAMNDDYAVLALRDSADNLDHHSFAGASRGMIANRVSHTFGFHGPSVVVDSGQSSSLVAVQLASEGLRAGASTLAIAGGVHLNMAGETALLEREFGALSPSRRTFAFDERADGYVRSQGGALVLLKPLRAAINDGNRIRAIIRGSAVGNAGRSTVGLTVPSVSGEAAVISQALVDAALGAKQIDYVETHGTGTAIGDPTEARALGEVFGGLRERPLIIGSVKTNIGHTGAASGMAGLLKAALSIENGCIPASLNFKKASAATDLEQLGLSVSTKLTPWPTTGEPRRAGVSSFGMGGTNAHLILEQAPTVGSTAERRAGPGIIPIVVSARSGAALTNQATRLLAWLADRPELQASDIAWSLASTRSVFEHRAVMVAASRSDSMAQLRSLAAGEPAHGLSTGRARQVDKTVFVFPGQGSQWLGIGRQLYDHFPWFATAFDRVAEALDAHLRLSLRQVMWSGDEALLQNTEFAQPALFAVEVALTALLRQWNVVPDLVMGHSVGEIAAAHVAGVLSLDDASALVAARGRLMAGLAAGGAMVAVAAAEAEVAPLLSDGVDIAAVNGPEAVVISGPEAAVGAVVDQLLNRGRRVHRLAVSHAFHSALMEPILEEFHDALAGLTPAPAQIELISNVTGEAAGEGYGSAAYWAEHVRQPVRFADSVNLAESLGRCVFVEVGPNAGLTSSQPLLARDRAEVESLLTAVGHLFAEGVDVAWTAILEGGAAVELPTYGFARKRFWLGDASAAAPDREAVEAGVRERLAGREPAERRRQLSELVRAHAAAVLGHASGHDIDPDRAFQDLGFGSMSGVELRNRLKVATGLPLSRTLIFDYPSTSDLVRFLDQQLFRGTEDESEEERIWSLLRNIPIQELRRAGLLDKLLLLAGQSENATAETALGEDAIDRLSPADLIAMALRGDDANDE